MKNLLIFCVAFPTLAFAISLEDQILQVSEFLKDPTVSSDVCVEEKATWQGVRPTIKKGEAKLSFDCKDFENEEPKTAEEKTASKFDTETITFYREPTPGLLEKHGIVLRTRVSDKTGESDVTVKFRPKTNKELLIDADADKKLSDLPSSAGEHKCEADVSYGNLVEVKKLDETTKTIIKVKEREENKNAESCSFTADGTTPTENHVAFLKAVGAVDILKDDKLDFSGLKPAVIKSTSWKKAEPAFGSKGLSFERWNAGGKCIFEVSAKFSASVVKNQDGSVDEVKSAEALKKAYDEKINQLIAHFKGKEPTVAQGNKTKRALDAIEAEEKLSK